MPEKVIKEGWGWPVQARKAHYFVNMRSLCDAWMFTGKLYPPEFSSPDDCKACTRKLAKRREEMSYRIVPTAKEIDDLLNECAKAEAEGNSKFFGMTYEQGIEAAIHWLTDAEREHPLDD